MNTINDSLSRIQKRVVEKREKSVGDMRKVFAGLKQESQATASFITDLSAFFGKPSKNKGGALFISMNDELVLRLGTYTPVKRQVLQAWASRGGLPIDYTKQARKRKA